MVKFRPLRADEVDLRVDRYTSRGAVLLCYKDARCDMRILDETVGAENWQREHYECKGNLFCRVGIKTDDGWAWKADCGTESYTEKEKGESSDSFKRACFNWGIGRELYTAPFIWIKTDDVNLKPKGTGYTTYDRFACTYMRVEDGKIVALNIENTTKRKTVFVYGTIELGKCCEVCGKPVADGLAQKCAATNNGHVYCSGTCKNKAAQNDAV